MSKYPSNWRVADLGDVVNKITSGGTPKADNPLFYGGDIPFLKIDDVTASSKYLRGHKTTITERGLQESSAKIVPAGTLLLTMYGTIGECCITTYPVATNQAIACFLDHPGIDLDYLYYCLRDKAREFSTASSQTTQANISATILKQTSIAVPPLPEQKKIAEILSGIDLVLEKINALGDKQEILHKSLLVDLMTGGTGRQNVVTEKQRRTPEKWKVCTLGSIFSLTSGKSKPKNLLSPTPVPGYVIPVYGGNGITGYATESLLESSTITIGRVGEYCGAIHLTPQQSWVTDNALYINKKVSDFNLRFMYYFLSFCDLSKLRKQGGQPLVSQKPIMELEVALPPLEEQVKIARIMDSTSKKLSALRSLNDKVKRIKMSVSQDLLSGRKRVSI